MLWKFSNQENFVEIIHKQNRIFCWTFPWKHLDGFLRQNSVNFGENFCKINQTAKISAQQRCHAAMVFVTLVPPRWMSSFMNSPLLTRTHGIDMDSWYWQGLKVKTWPHGIDNTHGIDLDSWYRIGAPESHKYERAECCSCVGFLAALSSSRSLVVGRSVRRSVRPSVGPSCLWKSDL